MDEPKKKEVREPTAQDFIEKYNKLVEETGWRVIATPVWVARDDGSFSLVINYSVGKLPQPNTQQ